MGDDTTAPAAPSIVSTIKVIGSLLAFAWFKNAESDAKQYCLYLNTAYSTPSKQAHLDNGNNLLKRVAHPVTHTTVNISKQTEGRGLSITAGATCYFWLSTVDRAGNESNLTHINSATPRKGFIKDASGAIVDEDLNVLATDYVGDGSTYKRTNSNEKTGAGRAYNALDSNSKLTSGVTATAKILYTDAQYTVPKRYYTNLRTDCLSDTQFQIQADSLTVVNASGQTIEKAIIEMLLRRFCGLLRKKDHTSPGGEHDSFFQERI